MKKVLLLLNVLPWLILSCRQAPVKIGLLVSLSGANRTLGLEVKDGVTLAVEEVNCSGGLLGREVLLITADDQSDKEKAFDALDYLEEQEVEFIIGPVTSKITASIIEEINRRKMVCISPTASSDIFSGKEDYFFRVVESSVKEAESLSSFARSKLGLEKVYCFYDADNYEYTYEWGDAFLRGIWGDVIDPSMMVPYNKDKSLEIQVADVLKNNLDGIVLVVDAAGSSQICLQIQKHNQQTPLTIISSNWAMSSEFLMLGGRAVEGVYFLDNYRHKSSESNSEYERFISAFEDRFAYTPYHQSAYGYESVLLVKEAYRYFPLYHNMNGALLSVSHYRGLQGEVTVDKWGDVTRPQMVYRVEDGQFTMLEEE